MLALLAFAGAAHSQVAGTLAVDSVNRYRGTGTDVRGPMLHAGVMADAPWAFARGAYAGVTSLWRMRDARLDGTDALVGWSGRFSDWEELEAIAPDWGWDAGLHRRHDGDGSRYDFSEAMLGLLAPGGALRAWWSPHYFGGAASSLYVEANAQHALDEHWRVFGHLGTLRYDRAAYGARNAGRTDAHVGIGWTTGAWDIQLARDALVAGHSRTGLDAASRRPAWVMTAGIAF